MKLLECAGSDSASKSFSQGLWLKLAIADIIILLLLLFQFTCIFEALPCSTTHQTLYKIQS